MRSCHARPVPKRYLCDFHGEVRVRAWAVTAVPRLGCVCEGYLVLRKVHRGEAHTLLGRRLRRRQERVLLPTHAPHPMQRWELRRDRVGLHIGVRKWCGEVRRRYVCVVVSVLPVPD